MSKYTPGPWKGYKDQGVYAGDNYDTPVFETGCGCCTESNLTQADADLIAAAPDLLACATALLAALDRDLPHNMKHHAAGERFNLRTAIAKATGQNQ